MQLTDPESLERELQGASKIGKLSILGKGVVRFVFTGLSGRDRVAVKIRRVDSRRNSMAHEAEMMKAANDAGIGPKCLGSSQDILKMQYVYGQRLPSWLSSLEGRGRRARARTTFKELFQQCARLDDY